MEMLGVGPSHDKTEILLVQNWSEQFPGASKLIIQTYFHKNDEQNVNNPPTLFLPIFPHRKPIVYYRKIDQESMHGLSGTHRPWVSGPWVWKSYYQSANQWHWTAN